MKRAGWWVACMALACKSPPPPAAAPDAGAASVTTSPVLSDVGPRQVSNATRYVITLHGDGFTTASRAMLDGAPLKTTFITPRRLHAVVEAGIAVPAGTSQGTGKLTVTGAQGEVPLLIVNDASYAVPLFMEPTGDGKRLFVSVENADELWVHDRATSTVITVPVGDGPRGMARWVDGAGIEWMVVCHARAPELRLVNTADPLQSRSISVPSHHEDIAVKDGRAYVSNHRLNAVMVVDLESGKLLKELPTGWRPSPLVVLDGTVVVANRDTEDLSVVNVEQGTEERVRAAPGTSILGGHTEKFAPLIMGSKRSRAIVASTQKGIVFTAGIGPNIGPNPDHMEVTMNGGVDVVDVAARRVLRHVHTGGVGESLALDEKRGVLFMASSSTGEVFALDARKLVTSDATARGAILGKVEVMPPDGVPRIRDEKELGTAGRAGVAMHSGPRAVRLVDGGRTLVVLNRLSRTVAEVDVSNAARMKVGKVLAPPRPTTQVDRWAGEIAYYTDMGRSGMTCDTCHPDGHTGGMLFTKGKPMQIYRSVGLRGAHDSAPFFTPQRMPSLAAMAEHVLARNRFQNLPPTPREIETLALYSSLFAPVPNPLLLPDGALPAQVHTRDGKSGDPRKGMVLFEEGGGCSAANCHPGPHYTADQDELTRGRLHDVGSTQFLPLRTEMQDARGALWPPPTLLGAWDQFPFFASGSAGLMVGPDGTLQQSTREPLRAVVDHPGAARHGLLNAMTPVEKNDLLAFLLTL